MNLHFNYLENKKMKQKVFKLKKYSGNAYKFDGDVLLTTALWADESRTPPYDDENWGEVSIEAFDTDEEYYQIYDLARGVKK